MLTFFRVHNLEGKLWTGLLRVGGMVKGISYLYTSQIVGANHTPSWRTAIFGFSMQSFPTLVSTTLEDIICRDLCSPMQCQTLTKYASLPVTALCIIPDSDPYLLAGEGGLLHLFVLSTNELFETVRVFEGQAIHNIDVASYHSSNGERQIVVSGGSLIACLTLSLSKPRLLGPTSLYDANDWILRVRYHDQGNNAGLFALVTANNSLLAFEHPASDLTSRAPKPLGQGPKTFLYSADICSSSHHTVIMAGGSAFGEIVVWSCHQDEFTSDWTSTSLHRLPSHNGSIFGICISPLIHIGSISTRLIVSCSDDRQIQVRDLRALEDHQPISTHQLVQDTGFGSVIDNDDDLIATTWGHQSRIWDVDFASISEAGEEATVTLLSRGEDATCQTWQLRVSCASSDGDILGKISLMHVDRHHSGKNIWSFVHYTIKPDISIISGGADGSLVRRKISSCSEGVGKVLTVPFTRIGVVCRSTVLKDYMILDGRQVLVLTASGDLLLHEYCPESTSTWQVIKSPSTSKVVKLSANCPPGIAIVAVENGLGVWRPGQGLRLVEATFPFEGSVASLHLAAMELLQPIQYSMAHLVANLAGSSTAMFLRLNIADCELSLTSAQLLYLPKGCIATTSHFSLISRTLIVGFRSGWLAFFSLGNDTTGDIDNPVCIPDIHGSDAITSVQPLKHHAINDKAWLIHILTTGRDGSYAIHEVTLGPEIAFQYRTVHRSSPPLGPNLEGAHLDIETNQILMFAFRSTNFVVWNETEQRILASVNCGGAHRNWDYRTDMNQHGRFVWTKASTFNLVDTGADEPELIHQGGHGREIKAVAVFPDALSSSRLDQYYLVASGAEDTEIRLFAVFTSAKSGQLKWKTLAVLRDHTTGLQHLAFSTNRRYLVSAGGAEQLYVWYLSFGLPYVEVGVVLQGKMPRTDDDSDVRIMDFHILENVHTPNCGDREIFGIAAAYSNGKVKIIQYEEGNTPGQCSFQRLHEIHFGSFCLTQINIHDFGNPHRRVIITAGTNGYLNLCDLKSFQYALTASDMPHVQKVHQNSIQCLQTLKIQPNLQLVVTGGDDNALGFTLQRVSATNIRQTDSHTLLIPKAHAAALTALGVITSCEASAKFQAIVVTAGNDQKIKAWKIEIPQENGDEVCSMEALVSRMKVCKIFEAWTFVADISNIAQLQSDMTADEKGGVNLIVVGVGMEVIRLMLL